MTQNLQQQQIQPSMDGRPLPERIGALEVRVGGIETGIQHIVAKLDSREKLPLGALLGTAGLVVTLITAIGGLAFNPLNNGITDLKAAIVKFEARSDSYMKREDIEAQNTALRLAFTEKFAVGTERRNDLQAKTDDRIARVERDVEALARQVVPREEHKIVRELQQRDYDLLRNRIERVEGRFEKRTDGLGREVERLSEHTLPRAEALSRNDAQDRTTGALQRRIDALEAPPRR